MLSLVHYPSEQIKMQVSLKHGSLENKAVSMFSKTERKAHFKCEGRRSEVGRRVVEVRIPVRIAGAHWGQVKRFLSSSGNCCLDTIKIQVASFCAVGFFRQWGSASRA